MPPRVLTIAVTLICLALGAGRARAQTDVSATWSSVPVDGDWNSGVNWIGGVTPAGDAGVATFGASGLTVLTFSASAILGGFSFDAGAPGYSFAVPENTNLLFRGAGIANQSASRPVITNDFGYVTFMNAASAGDAEIVLRNDASLWLTGTATAGQAMIDVDGDSFVTVDGHGTLGGATVLFREYGYGELEDDASAGTARITNYRSIDFNDRATAASATIENHGTLHFQDQATAAAAHIGGDGLVMFIGSSTLAAATLDLAGGGRLLFYEQPAAATGSVTVASGALFDQTAVTAASLRLGALAGGGEFRLGAPGGGTPDLVVDGDFTLQSGAVLGLLVRDALDFTRIEVGGRFTAAGRLELAFDPQFAAPVGPASFDLLDFSSAQGGFDDYALPTLAAGLAWDTSGLLTTGELAIVFTPVPEPETWLLVAGGLLFSIAGRCRDQRRRVRGRAAGFTLVEIMIVVVIIGLLAAMAIPAFQRVRQKARINRLASDLRTHAQAFETYALQNGSWPANGSLGVEPPGMEGQLKGWAEPTPLGGHFTWDNWPEVKKITVFEAFENFSMMVELDRQIDDGDPGTGRFRLFNAHYSLVLEETP